MSILPDSDCGLAIPNDFVHLVRWRNGTFSFLFGQSQATLLVMLDRIGDPADAEVRVVPRELMSEVIFDAVPDSEYFGIDADVERMLWRKCTKQVWPLEALGS